MKTEELLEIHKKLCDDAREIMKGKNHDYRGGSDEDPFANFRDTEAMGVSPIVGILIRMRDKIMRIKTFDSKGQLQVKGEGLDDAIMDIINYAILIKGMIEMDAEKTNERTTEKTKKRIDPTNHEEPIYAWECKYFGRPRGIPGCIKYKVGLTAGDCKDCQGYETNFPAYKKGE